MFEELRIVLDFDPVLIGAFAGLSMMMVQMFKQVSPLVKEFALMVNLALSVFFATMVVFEITWVLEVTVITFLIMSAASGVYSSSKSKTVIELPDYSDDK